MNESPYITALRNRSINFALNNRAALTVRCCWCFTPRPIPLNRKAKCKKCGKYGITVLEERCIRNVYVEDKPA